MAGDPTSTGQKGEDVTVPLPIGSVVADSDTGERLAD